MPQTETIETPRVSGRGNILMNLVVLAITVLMVAGVLEVTLRIIYARSLDFSMEMWKYAVKLKHPVPNPHLSFAHVPNSSAFLMGNPVSINSHGLRDREFSLEKPAGVYRILMLGDSTTFGWGVAEENTVAKILERRLGQTCSPGPCRFEVLNAGVGNYGTVQEYTHYLTYDRAFHPDLVVLEYFINDAEPVPTERQPGADWPVVSARLRCVTIRWHAAADRYAPELERLLCGTLSGGSAGAARCGVRSCGSGDRN